MTSAIDATKPIAGNPTTSSVRSNFTAAKSEIEALQNRNGWADYQDTATTTTPISVSPSTWTKLTNNKLGANTQSALPSGVTNLWNAVSNQLVLTEIPLKSTLEARIEIAVTTTAANQVVRLRTRLAIGTIIEFSLESTQNQFKTAGAQNIVQSGSFYIGSDNVRLNPGEFQIWSDASATVVVNGWYIRVSKFIA